MKTKLKGDAMKDIIKEFRIFNFWEYKEEEDFLTQMHQKGYAFESLKFPGIYTFRKTDNKMAYRLDYVEELEPSERDSYIKSYTDDGWEYLLEVNGYYYFRTAKEIGDQRLIDSKTRKKIFDSSLTGMIFPMAMLLIVVFLPIIVRLVKGPNPFWQGFSDGAGTVISIIFTGIFMYLISSYICSKRKA